MTTHSWSVILGLELGVAMFFTPHADASRPPPPIRHLPGIQIGRTRTEWLGPYVSATCELVGRSGFTSVRWFDADGKLIRDIQGQNMSTHPGFISSYRDGVSTIYAVNSEWSFELPRKPGPAGYINASENSRTFIYQHHPEQGQIAIDVYVQGKFVETLGPFVKYKGADAQLGKDGSLSLVTWKSVRKRKAQVVVAGPDGKLRFQADCRARDVSTAPLVGPGGRGVLVKSNLGNRFTYYLDSRRVAAMDISPNPTFIDWVPGTDKALFASSVGHKHHYLMIDWSKGKILWRIPDPSKADTGPTKAGTNDKFVMFRARTEPTQSIIADNDLVLLGGHEFIWLHEPGDWMRTIYAVDGATGETVAKWRGPSLGPFRTALRFVRLDKKLFVTDGKKFAEITPEDIAGKKNGWE